MLAPVTRAFLVLVVHHGMHGTDASALVHIVGAEERGEPLTQAELSRLVGLTTGATSSLLNRLEAVGHVERRRDRADRRVVTLRSTASMHRAARPPGPATGPAGATSSSPDAGGPDAGGPAAS
ncbi:MarR family transcriptional regulator [Kineococcus sp. T13]|nr:MarR family transcriptional regulator [Kineococcus vitellinus]